MRFVFWQNILSMHQSAFIRSIAERYNVILVAEKEIVDSRIIDGWELPDFGSTLIEIGPSKKRISEILENNRQAIHIFSGTKAFPMVHHAFRLAIKKNIRTGIIAEAGMGSGIIGYLRRRKTILFCLKYGKKIDFILAMGNLGVDWYTKNYFSKRKIFPFFYVVEDIPNKNELNDKKSEQETVKLIVVAQLIKRKGIDILIRALHSLSVHNWTLKIIGAGNEKENIINLINYLKLDNKISVIGASPHNKTMSYISSSDLLILPSRFDGWGAVVNEALIRGIPVITSNKCGASCLIDGKVRGAIFELKDASFVSVLESWIKKVPYNQSTRDQIIDWAKCISGESSSNYFLKILQCVYESKERPKAPWVESD